MLGWISSVSLATTLQRAGESGLAELGLPTQELRGLGARRGCWMLSPPCTEGRHRAGGTSQGLCGAPGSSLTLILELRLERTSKVMEPSLEWMQLLPLAAP